MWSPYRNLLFISLSKCHQKQSDAHKKVIYRSAKEMAENIACFAHGRDTIRKDAKSGVLWPLPNDEKPDCKHSYISSRLKTFVMRGRRRGRKILDRLILAFTASGFGEEKVSKYTYQEYDTASDVPPLSQKEVSMYHAYFWGFGTLKNIGSGIRWIKRHFPTKDELKILKGDISMPDVRAKLGTTGRFNYASCMRRLAQRSLRAMERCIAEINAIDQADLVYGQQQRFSNANVRNTAAMISSLAPVVKNYKEVREDSGKKGDQPMGEHIEERLGKVLDEAEKYEKHYGDWQDTHKGNTLDDLMEENEEFMEKTNVEKSTDKLSGPERNGKEEDINIDELL